MQIHPAMKETINMHHSNQMSLFQRRDRVTIATKLATVTTWLVATIFLASIATTESIDPELAGYLLRRDLRAIENMFPDLFDGDDSYIEEMKLNGQHPENDLDKEPKDFELPKKEDLFSRHVRSMMLAAKQSGGRHVSCSGRKHKAIGCDDGMTNGWMRMLSTKKRIRN